MKITLKNFRCYTDSTFDFGTKGITLLSGISGTGKTSIMLGIHFALFGSGTKLVSYGKSTCKVIVEFQEMIITRTKRPNRVVVKDEKGEYEDDAAQSIINKKFGDTFKTTGYISQNARDSFITMSPIEKLCFLEKFAFQGTDLNQIKKRCKDLINTRNETLLKTTSQLEMASLMIKELNKPKEVSFPLNCGKDPNKQEKAIKNEIIRDKNTSVLIKRCKKRLLSLEKEKQSLEIYEAKSQSKKESLDSVTNKISELEVLKNEIYYQGDERIKSYEDDLSVLISQRELILTKERHKDDKKRLENMKDVHLREINTKLEQIKETLWKEYSKEEITPTIVDYQQIIKDIEKISDLKKKLQKYEVDEEILYNDRKTLEKYTKTIVTQNTLYEKLLIQQEIFQCPSCEIELRIRDEELHILENSVATEIHEQEDIDIVSEVISNLKKNISNLERSISIKENRLIRHQEIQEEITNIKEQYEELPSLKEIRKDLEYLRSYKSSQLELETQLKKLDNKQFSSTILSFEKDVNNQKKKIDHLQKTTNKTENNMEEEELRKNIIIQKQNNEKLQNINNDIFKLSKQESNYKKQLEEYKNEYISYFKTITNLEDLNTKITLQLQELSNLETKKKKYQQNIENIEKYQEYKKILKTYNLWVEKITKLKKEETRNRKLYAAANQLKESILEAESIAMLNIISSINTHSQPYLDCFFPNNPISVKIVTFKENKKGKTTTKKPQINMQIEYKGMEADINMLSGGEISRIILAFALALGEMFNTPIMLLDECTSSLDQELTSIVMDGIRENFNGKLVIIVAHQVVKGQFDKVIKIG